MKISFYGRVGDIVGRQREVNLPSADLTVAELRQVLARLYPEAAADLTKSSLRACVADCIVGEDFRLTRAEAIEFFPPLSGG